MALTVLIHPEHINVSVRQDIAVIHTTANVPHHKSVAPRTENVDQMRNVSNLVSVFVLRHSIWIQVTIENVKALAKYSHVE